MGGEGEFDAVGGDEDRAHFGLGQVADDVEGLEFGAEAFVLSNRNDEQQLVVIAAVHCGRHRVDAQLAAQGDAPRFEGNLVRIDLGAQRAVPRKAHNSVCEAPGDEIAIRGRQSRLDDLRGRLRAQFGPQVRPDQHLVLFQQLPVRRSLVELDAFPLQRLQTQVGGPQRTGNADQIARLPLRPGIRYRAVVAARGGQCDRQAVAGGLQVQTHVLVPVLFRRGGNATPELFHLREIQLGGNADLHGQGPGPGQHGIQFARHAQHGLAAQVRQREIDQVEIHPLQQHRPGGGDAVPVRGLEPQRLFEGAVRRPLEQLPDGLDAAQFAEGLRHARDCAAGC